MELLEEILSRDNMNKAYKKVYQNKGASGIDGITVEEIADYIKENRERILNQIRKRKYKPHLKSYQKIKRKLKELTKRSWSISLETRIKKINQLVVGWVNYFKVANMKKAIQGIDEHLRTRIRVIIWKQWKIPAKRECGLKKLGMNQELAHNLANARKRYQQICNSQWMKFAINIERFKKRGLVFLLDQYQKVHIEI